MTWVQVLLLMIGNIASFFVGIHLYEYIRVKATATLGARIARIIEAERKKSESK